MATTADIRNGLVLDLDGKLMQITYFQHVKPGKGSAFVRTKMRNVRTGAVLERTFPSGERFTAVELMHRPMTYSYRDGENFHFMDLQSFDDIPLTAALIGAEQMKYLKEGMECTGLVHDEHVMGQHRMLVASPSTPPQPKSRVEYLVSTRQFAKHAPAMLADPRRSGKPTTWIACRCAAGRVRSNARARG